MTEKEMRNLCVLWQKRLRLQDWRIDVRLADSVEVDQQRAKCRVFQESKQAIVRIGRPEAIDETDEFYQSFPESFDLELTLVHELLHIPFDGLLNSEAEEHEAIMQEQALDFLAEALVSLSREDK